MCVYFGSSVSEARHWLGLSPVRPSVNHQLQRGSEAEEAGYRETEARERYICLLLLKTPANSAEYILRVHTADTAPCICVHVQILPYMSVYGQFVSKMNNLQMLYFAVNKYSRILKNEVFERRAIHRYSMFIPSQQKQSFSYQYLTV